MIDPKFCQMMAEYNQWQNNSLYREADALDQAARDLDRGAFFKSIQGTLSHIIWGDMMWMARFDEWPLPEVGPEKSAAMFKDWDEQKARRVQLDAEIKAWTEGLVQSDLERDLVWYSGILKRDLSKPRWILIQHLFNHQTHHRGQVHAMLTAAGRTPDATDLGFMPLKT